MNAINNYNIYKNEMKKSLQDKLFFIGIVNFDILVDFGCANGCLIKHLAEKMPNKNFIGYDNNPKMIEKANLDKPKNVMFFSDFNDIEKILKQTKKKKAVLCSSLIHEVYSYSNQEEIDTFWHRIFSDIFDYIIIRDMTLEKNIFEAQSKTKNVNKIKNKASFSMIQDFENIWGSLDKKNNLIHFLMKYRYEDNWKREVEENYFSLNLDEMKNIIEKQNNYTINYFEHYTLPFNKTIIKKDFDIFLKTKTHIKVILERKAL